jgi:hypothetical protein
MNKTFQCLLASSVLGLLPLMVKAGQGIERNTLARR